MADYLLHSMGEFSEIFDAAFEVKKPKILVEIGSEYGGSTKVILNYAKNNSAYAHIIDPSPYVDLSTVLSEYSDFYKHIKEKSLDALTHVPAADFYFIDGDHNYYTVSNELKLIYEKNPKAWIFLHDVGWPCAYRDMYYNTADIPKEYLHDHTFQDGVNLQNEIVANGGFRGAGYFAFSKVYGGERNGVLKAVENFFELHSNEIYLAKIMPILGMGLIVPKEDQEIVQKILAPYQTKLINKMEQNRLELYLKVIELQDRLNNYNKLPFRIIKKLLAILGSK